MKVDDILETKRGVLYTTTPQASLVDAVAAMTECDVGSLVVFDAHHLAGMLTFREVLQVVYRRQSDWQQVKVAEVMTAAPVVIEPDMEMESLVRLMTENPQRYLPVMDGTTLLGVVSLRDVTQVVLESQMFENNLLRSFIRVMPGKD